MTRGTNNAGDKGTSGQNVPKSPKGLKNKKSKFRMESEQEKISKSKLRMETREDKLNRARKKLEGKKPPKPRGPVRRVLGAAGWSAHGFVHGKVYEVEHENVGTEGAHRSELLGEAALRHGTRYAKKRIREHPARAVHKAEAQYIKARADYQFRMAAQENPELAKNAITRYWHKQKLKKQYAKQARQAAKQTAKQGAKAAGKTAAATEKLAERAVAFVKRHPVGALIALACVVLVLSLQSCASSLVSLGNAAAGAVGATTYPAEDGDMLGAEAAYCSLEAELQHYLDTYESTHDYDEYHFDLDAIEHDPYVLISLLSAWHEGEWTLADVRPTLQMLFDRQYTLTENVVKERRYYIETDTWTDEDGNIIDIQQRMAEGKGPAYERWAKVYNLKQMAAALQFLQENNLTDYDALAAKTTAAVDRAHALAGELQTTEAALSKVSGLMGAVVDYAKARPVFDGYKAARYSKKYLAEHEAELATYRAARAAMNELLGGEKLPKMDALKKQRRELADKKKALYAEYRQAQRDMREAVAVKANIDHLLGLTDGRDDKEQTR